MKARISILMLVLGCLIVMSVYAAEEGTTEKAAETLESAAMPAPEEAAKTVSLETEMQKVSYIIGTQIAGSIKKANIEVNIESLALGIRDALEGNKLALSQDEMKTVYGAWQQKMQQKQAAANLAKGKAFLEANKAKEDVKVTDSGLQYKIIEEGTGESPAASDKVKVHYRGRLVNGQEFDSSYKRGKPAEFPVTGVIKGWTEALQLMKEGAKWELYIPPELAYGTQNRPGLPGNSTLIFEVELLEVLDEESQ